MKGSSASEVLFISVNHSITLMGKVWLIVMIFLRVLILLFAGYPLYQDEQERFVCNTIQPGCANVCYDTFSPVSLFRFWLVQLITLCLPFIIFVIYVVHKVLITLSIALSSTGQRKTFQLFKVHQDLLKKICLNKIPLDVEQQQCFTGVYILQLLFRTLLEAGFGAANYYLFGFYIPSRFLCQHPPCTTQVDCYISRPTEKTVLLNFMFAMATLSLFLNFVDFFCAIKHSVRQKTKGKMMMETIFKDEQCFFSAEVASTEMDPNSTLAQQDLPTQPGETGSFRKRRGSKGSCGGGEFHSGQEETNLGCCSHPYSPGSICCNKGNNKYLISQEDVLERNGSEVALWPLEPMGTPGSIRINKRSKLKPPPPTRRDLRLPSRESAALVGDVSAASAVYARSFGQYTLVELSSAAEQGNEGEQERRSEWV